MEYWIEDSFATQLFGNVWIEMSKGILENSDMGMPEMDDFILTDRERRTKQYVEELFSEVEISKPEHINFYMKPSNIISMIDKTDLIY